MPRASAPHLVDDGRRRRWRFRWTVRALDAAGCRAAAERLRGPWHNAKPRRAGNGWHVLSWAVVRSTEAAIWAEFARYKALTGGEQRIATVAAAIDRWQAEHPGGWQQWATRPLLDFCGADSVEVESGYLERYCAWLRGRKRGSRVRYSDETIRKLCCAASALFRWAVDAGLCETSPRPARVTMPDPVPKALTRAELAAVLASVRRLPVVRDMLRLALATGMRIGEIRTLRWAHVRDDAITLPPHSHKGGHRSGKLRVVPLLPDAARILARQRGASATYVFVAPRTGKPYTRHGLNAMLYRRGVTPHRLRHTVAQRAIDAGVPVDTVAAMLGHRHSRMVWVYAKIRDESVRAGFQSANAQARLRKQARPLPESSRPTNRSRKPARRPAG